MNLTHHHRALLLVGALVLFGAACGASTPVVVAGDEPTTETPATEAPTADPTTTPEDQPIEADALATLEAARAHWESTDIDTYEYTYSRFCECSEVEFGPNTVVVVDGVVTEVRGPDGTPVEASDFTIMELFDISERSIRQGEQTANEYQSELGYPIMVSLDVEAQAVDGGFAMRIINFA